MNNSAPTAAAPTPAQPQPTADAQAPVVALPVAKKKAMKTSNFVAIMAVVTVLIVLGAGYLVKVLGSSILLDHKLISYKSTAAKTLKADVATSNALVKQYNMLGSQQANITDMLPTDPDFPGMANTLEAIAGAAGVNYVSSSSSSSTAATATAAPTTGATSGGTATPQSQGFSFTFTGGYDGLARALTNLEASARPIHVDDINVTGTNSKLNVTVDGTTYYQPASTFNVSTETVK